MPPATNNGHIAIKPELRALDQEMRGWRRDFHAHPELAFEEVRTSNIIARELAAIGLDVHEHIAKTGIAAVLKRGDGPMIALRADMDALAIMEENAFAHKSTHPGIMHACGHDGHAAMLLGAAKYLTRHGRFSGTVVFIFQPAEENEGGAQAMIEEGLLERFPFEAIYGLHNFPGLEAGVFAINAGPFMASFDTFEITVTGTGGHGAMPHLAHDPIGCASALVTAIQSVDMANFGAAQNAVIAITQIKSGDTWNAIPAQAVIRGGARTFSLETQNLIEKTLAELCAQHSHKFTVQVACDYRRRYPVLVNSRKETALATRAAEKLLGHAGVKTDTDPIMGSEDFAFFLEKKPGAFILMGNGPGEGGCLLHNPSYDFNDEILCAGAAYWACVVETALSGAP